MNEITRKRRGNLEKYRKALSLKSKERHFTRPKRNSHRGRICLLTLASANTTSQN